MRHQMILQTLIRIGYTLWKIGVEKETQQYTTTTTYHVPRWWLQLLLVSLPAAIVTVYLLVGW